MPVPFIGGNWKSNGTRQSVDELVAILNKMPVEHTADVIVAPTFLHIGQVQGSLTNEKVQIAAQNCIVKAGAFTGEVSAAAVVDYGIKWVIIGHSERRATRGETNEVVAEKIRAATAAGLNVIACLGETLEQRTADAPFKETVLLPQLEAILAAADAATVVLAYEPVWAIGTGKVATPAEAEDVHAWIRSILAERLGDAAANVRIIYGGSVTGGNAADLYALPNVDGFLVGGASLKPEFADIVAATAKKA